MFDCTILVVECLDTFPLDAFQGWLHLDEQQPPKKHMGRHLVMQLGNGVQVDHSIASVDHFIQQLRQRFLNATSCCPFSAYIVVTMFGGPNTPVLQPFVEDNERTGELLEFGRDPDHQHCYRVERRRRESATAGQEQDDRGAEVEERRKTMMVFIRKVVQGDKQVVDF